MFLFFTALHLMSLARLNKWIGASIGAGIFVITFILIIVLKKHVGAKYAIICVNAIADGIAASSLFVYMGAFPEIWHSVVLLLTMCALFLLYLVLTKLNFLRTHYIICMTLYLSILVASAIAAAATTKLPIFALACLALLPFTAFFITTVIRSIDDTEHIGKISIASFAALAAVIVAVLIVVSEGDLDLGGGSVDGIEKLHKPKFNPYDYKPSL